MKLTEAQQAVVDNRGGSLLVSAAAGSGKTKVLVERLFRYILDENRNVDEFLIITYTKAAAAELRGKIASELSAQLAVQSGNRHLQSQLMRIYHADIKTVDSFCTALLRENTHLLAAETDGYSLTPDFRVLDDNEAQLLRRRVLNRTLEQFYTNLDTSGEQLADTMGAGRDDSALEDLVLDLYDKLQSHGNPSAWLQRNQECWLIDSSSSFDDTVYAPVLRRYVARKGEHWAQTFRELLQEMQDCKSLVKNYADRFQAVTDSLETLSDAARLGTWDDTREAVSRIIFPRLGTVRGATDSDLKLRAKKLWDLCKKEVKVLQKELSVSGEEAMEDLTAIAPAMRALLKLTAQFSEDYRQEKLHRNTADFSDQEHLALRLLVRSDGSQTELGRQVSQRYIEVLVDEYQDTNEVQNSIFYALSRQGKNLFMVGDVKQSIYRFRLADPTIFLDKYQHFTDYKTASDGEERKILLSKNFRSRKEILDAANFVFSNILSPEMGEMVYGDDEALHFGAEYYPERQDCQTEFHLIGAQKKSKKQPNPVKKTLAEACFVAMRIRQMLDEGYPVTGKDGTLRPCLPEDFAILMRSPGSRALTFANALAEQDIPCSFEENADFFSTMEIAVTRNLLEILDNPRQDIPLISVLRSPIFGFTADRLSSIRGKTPDGDFYHAVEQDGGEDCRSFLETLNQLRIVSRTMSVERLLWHLYNKLNILGIFGAMTGGTQRRENLIALTEHAAKFEMSGYRGLFAFVNQLRRLIANGQAPITRGSDISGGVQLMSVHRSKGLEFPIVLLCDLDHSFSKQDFHSPVLVHPELGLGPQRVDLERRIQYSTLARQAVEQVLRRENLSEEQRILYVAMTRAKEKLILVESTYSAEKLIQKLAAGASCPVSPETVASANCQGDWVLTTLLCRPEAENLRHLSGLDNMPLHTDSDSIWKVYYHDSEEFRTLSEEKSVKQCSFTEEIPFDPELISFVYPWKKETLLPAKLTATQLKGRALDDEIAEGAQKEPYLRPLTQPKFRQELHGLTPAESGTATHLALQYLDFCNRDVSAQVEQLRQKRLLSDEQAAAVNVPMLTQFLNSPLAEEIRNGTNVRREYPFTLLVSADTVDSEVTSEDKLLLQGVVDCCYETPDGIVVVDFKTDRVFGKFIQERVELYRPQLEAYSLALSQVLEKPVIRRILYFLLSGQAIEI